MSILRVNKIAASGQTSENTGSVFFDGDGDSLEISDPNGLLSLPDSFTVELFVNFSTVTSAVTFVCKTEDDAQFAWFLQYISSSGGIRFYPANNGGTGTPITFSWTPSAGTWYHLALTRDESNDVRMFVDGIQIGSTGSDSSNLSSTGRITIGDNIDVSGTQELNGYISNLRVVKGKALYTSNFTPPTTELEVTPETVLLCCHDGENIFAEKTGKIIAAYGDRSSGIHTVTESPIGITTFQPGLTRSVDVTAGPVLQGSLEYNSQNFLVLPKGITEEQFPNFATNAVDAGSSSARGVFHQGQNPARVRSLDFVNLPTLGNAQDFGDLLASPGGRDGTGSLASSTRGIFAGGRDTGGTSLDDIEFITIATQGDAQIFGDLSATRRLLSGLSNSTRGVFVGGLEGPTNVDTMEYITIATTGGTTDFGNLVVGTRGMGAFASPTKGVFGGGSTPTMVNTISFITIASTGDAQDFGDLLLNRNEIAGASNSTRGLFAGGYNPTFINTIQYVTIQSSGNAIDFGDLLNTRNGQGGAASSTRALFAGGYDGSVLTDDIFYVNIATTGNAVSFGELIPAGANQVAGCSNGHGGLG